MTKELLSWKICEMKKVNENEVRLKKIIITISGKVYNYKELNSPVLSVGELI